IPEQRERENSVNAKVTGHGADADWRSALRAAGAAPGTRPPTEPERRKVGEVREPERPEPDRAEAGRPEPRAAQARAWSVPEASQLYDDSPGDAGKEELAVPPRKRAGKFAADASGSRSRTGSEPAATPVPLGDVPVGIEVGSGGSALYDRTIGSLRSIDAVAAAVQKCTRCPLYETATHGVPGEGNPDAGLVCVGEAPGANEDATGRPFVGQAGQLLTKILAAVNLSREDVFICNVLKHRPPGNRNPRPEEVEACSPYLLRQLELVKPRVIVAFGTFAAQTLLETKLPLGKLRGQIHRYHGIPLVVTYHPAELLRNSAWK